MRKYSFPPEMLQNDIRDKDFSERNENSENMCVLGSLFVKTENIISLLPFNQLFLWKTYHKQAGEIAKLSTKMS